MSTRAEETPPDGRPARPSPSRGRERLAAAYTRFRGLRTRLIVGFLIVSALSALITAALTFRQARTAILARTQNTAVHDLRAQMESLGPDLPFPPRREDLQNLVVQLDRAGGSRNWRTYAQYEDGPVVPQPWRDGRDAVTDGLRESVRDHHAPVFQRVDRGGKPWLAIGMPVDFTDAGASGGGGRSPEGEGPSSGGEGRSLEGEGPSSGGGGRSLEGERGAGPPGSAARPSARSSELSPVSSVELSRASSSEPSSTPSPTPSPAPSSEPSAASGKGKPSGLVVYAEFSLADEKADVDALVTAAQAGALPALALAVVPALFAARRVLLPVRRLREAAERITSGELDTRSPVTGRDELADLTATFNDMARALEKDDAELRRMEANARRFAADVSHELRTPLAAMSAVTEVLDEDAARLDPDTADAVRLISSETAKLARMVEDLIEVSRFDAGAADLHLDEIDVAVALRKTLQLRGWQEQVDTELPDGLRARFDPRRIDVVVANLVGNALRHGGTPVRLTAYARTGRLRIDVADRGPGIDPEALPHVFERFYKADAARARSGGSGLGLAIAMENVRLHGGTLRAANAPDGGAVFSVDVPLDPLAGPGQPPSAPDPGTGPGPAPDPAFEDRP
ncbi:HAMP domain-containing sensor histidine kinase [Streptomyces sp. NPDC007100]|uniref:sensor histidine kinase n=1 Tax=Streptomyces sp. NPDC007100 TaxID=3155602 RepID=UPI0033E7CEB8